MIVVRDGKGRSLHLDHVPEAEFVPFVASAAVPYVEDVHGGASPMSVPEHDSPVTVKRLTMVKTSPA